jgi:hypothetical protein
MLGFRGKEGQASLSAVMSRLIFIAISTVTSCSIPRKATVSYAVRVSVNDGNGTYSNSAIWRSGLKRRILAINSEYEQSFEAHPIDIILSDSARLTVFPTSRLNGSNGVVMIPERLFRRQVAYTGSDRIKLITAIASRRRMKKPLDCRYDRSLPTSGPPITAALNVLCPTITFQSSSMNMAQSVNGTGLGKQYDTIAESLRIEIEILGT